MARHENERSSGLDLANAAPPPLFPTSSRKVVHEEHPLQYAIVAIHPSTSVIVYGSSALSDEQLRRYVDGYASVSRFNRCPTCEQWSPCDVRESDG